MIRFIMHYFDNIGGIEIYPIISLLLFFMVFTIMLIIVLKIPKNTIKEFENLPLDSKNSKKS